MKIQTIASLGPWPDDAADLRADHPQQAALRKPWRRALAGVVGLLERAFAPPASAIPWKQVQRIAILRLDHLGDLLLCFPFLAELRRALPKAKIELFVAPWNRELAELCPSVDAVQVVEAPWFARPQARRLPLGALRALAHPLKAGNYDLGVELRGDPRHLLALRMAGVKHRLAFSPVLGGSLITHSVPWALRHESEQGNALLQSQGLALKAAPRKPLKLSAKAKREATALMKKQHLKKGFIALHPSAGSPSRLWTEGHWQDLIRRLPHGRGLGLIGSADEREGLLAMAKRSGRPDLKVLAGDSSVAGLAALLEKAGLLICLNSGPGHIAAAMGRPVLSLFSGANDPVRWGPLGAKVLVLRSEAPCSPCELAHCPYDDACMKAIPVPVALSAALELLKARA